MDSTKNIIKDNERTSMNERNTLLYKKHISLILFSKGTQFVVSLRNRWRDIYSKRGLLLAPYLLSGAKEVPTLVPPCKSYRQRRLNASDRLRIPGSTPDSDWTLNLTAWFSYHVVPFGYTPVRPAYPDAPQSLCLLVTRNEPKIHVICYITLAQTSSRISCRPCFPLALSTRVLKKVRLA